MISARWVRAGLGLALSVACGEAPSVPPEAVSDAPDALPSCDAQACSALAGPCQIGECDSRTGACRLSAAREGEPCLEGNVCGPALCRNGECSALEPSRCPVAENEPCRTSICRPERGGCVSEPLTLPGATCATALPVQGIGQSALAASSQCGDHARQFPGCTSGLLGPSAHFALDLRATPVPTPVAIVIDAEFSFEAVLTQGPCGDSILEACATPLQADGRSRALSLTLTPGYYELVVTGRSEGDLGIVHVSTVVEPAICSGPPLNDECAAGLALDAALATQTIIGNAACGKVSAPTRCGPESVGDVFYDLDLSARPAPTLLQVDVSEVEQDHANVFAALFSAGESGCGEFAMCGTRFASLVPPGRYRIGVSQLSDYRSAGGSSDSGYRRAAVSDAPSPTPFALRVRLQDADCTATKNDTWQTAIELDPNVATQRLSGNTACASDDFSGACNGDRGAPELFYRLDLRSQREPRSAFFSGASASDLVAYLLLVDATGVPARVAGCKALSDPVSYATSESSVSFTLAPRLYYFVIDGRVANAGGFDLELRNGQAYPVPKDCLDDDLIRCLDDSEPACTDSRASPECLSAAVECGLEPAVYAAFCASFAGCCDGTADPAECRTAWSSNLECR